MTLNLKNLKTAETKKLATEKDKDEQVKIAKSLSTQDDGKAKWNLKLFPSPSEIESFQSQLNSESIKSMAEQFQQKQGSLK